MKFNFKTLTISSVVLFLAAAVIYPLLSGPLWEPYTPAKLDALNNSGQPMLVAIHADWCSTCKTQERILQDLLQQPEFKEFKMLRVDYDLQREVVRAFGVEYQSTLIVFRNGHEMGRSTADMSPVSIANLLRSGLSNHSG